MSFKQQSGLIGLMLASSTIPHVAYSQVFMTEEQAVKTLFKDLKMNRKLVILAPEDIRQIEHMSDERVRSASITVWICSAGG